MAEDDGRPSMAEALDALRSAPPGTTCAACASRGITALHVPHGEECRMVQAVAEKNAGRSLDDAGRAVMLPGGAGWDEWKAAFGAANPVKRDVSVTGSPALAEALRESLKAARAGYQPDSGPDEPAEPPPGRAGPSMPPDPFPVDIMAGTGIADMLKAMTAGGVPLGSAERIIGAMLAAHGIMAKEAGDDHA